VHQGHAQFSVDNIKYRRRKKTETNPEHIARSFAATKRGAVTRMGTMDIEWMIGELDR